MAGSVINHVIWLLNYNCFSIRVRRISGEFLARANYGAVQVTGKTSNASAADAASNMYEAVASATPSHMLQLSSRYMD
jgi:hypothetical protein